jgi:RNA polymerase sigma-70 factor, ECF subfamily
MAEGTQQAAHEEDLRRLWQEGRWDAATERLLRCYGREIAEFLAALHRSDADGGEVFSLFAEGVWRGMAKFEGACSFRTWAYAVARLNSLRYRRDGRRREARSTPLPEGSSVSYLVERLRSETATYLKTQTRTRIAELRETLPEADQTLLMLRVDRELSWIELAQVLHEDEQSQLQGEALKREAARLRKRFQLVKTKLYELGKQEGLVGDTTS